MQTQRCYLTRAKYDALIKELAYMEGEGNQLLAKLLASSPGSGMGRPNDLPAHHLAGEYQGYLQEIKGLIGSAEIIDDLRGQEPDLDKVVLGSTVRILYEGDDERVDYVILGQSEVDSLYGRISCFSPIGAALLGKKKGDKVTVTLSSPPGNIRMSIIDVLRLPLDFSYSFLRWKNVLESAT